MLLLRLIKRNILVYARDRANIFFSLLAMIIVVGLMVVFLGKMNADNVVQLLNQYGGTRNSAADRSNAEQLVMLWTLTGIIIVNSVTITLSMVGIMVEDEARKRLSSFYVTPVNRTVFVLGYIFAAFIMGIIMCLLTLFIGEGYSVLTGGTILSLDQFLKTLLFIILNVFTSTCLMYLLANMVHTASAFAGLSTIIGTLVGFLSGIYLPIGMLPEKVQTVLKCLPLLHGSSFLRETLTKQIMTDTFVNCPVEFINKYKEAMGITILFNDKVVSTGFQVAFLIISGIIFICVSAILQRSRHVIN